MKYQTLLPLRKNRFLAILNQYGLAKEICGYLVYVKKLKSRHLHVAYIEGL